jgi:hypothetical protein
MADAIRIDISANTSGASSGIHLVTQDTRALQEALSGAGAAGLEAGEEISAGMQKAEYSTMEARHAAMLLGEETGVRIPRALTGIIAQSETLGPIMATAFSGIALIAFAELAAKAAQKFTDWYISTFILTEAVKAMDAEMAKDNKTIIEANAKAAEAKTKFEEMGLSVQQLDKLKMDRWTDEWNKMSLAVENADNRLAQFQSGRTTFTQEESAAQMGLPSDATREQIIAAMSGQYGALMAQKAALEQEGTIIQKQAEMDQAAAAKEAHDKEVAGVMEYAKAGVFAGNVITEAEQKVLEKMGVVGVANSDLAGRVKLDATQQAEAIGLVAEAHRKLMAETEPDNKILEAQLEKQMKDEENVAKAKVKELEAELQLNAAQVKSLADAAQIAVMNDRASGNKIKEAADVKVLVKALEDQKAAELAIVDAKIAEAEAAMQVAFSAGGLDSADFINAEAQYKEYQARRIAIADAANQKIAAAQDRELSQEMKAWNTYLNNANAAFASSVMQIVTGHETMKEAAQKALTGMAKAFIEYTMKMIEQAILQHSIHKALDASDKSSAASAAAAKAGKAVADIPVVGPALAVVAAATVYGALMAFDRGGVSEGGLSLLHPKEAVLTPQQTENFQKLTEGGGLRPVTFAPVINVHGDFDTDTHMPEIWSAFQGRLKAMGASI